MWLDQVGEQYGDRLEITWKNFQLEQVNSSQGPDWKVWDQPDIYQTRSLVAAMAGEAARRQGVEAHSRFHLALLKARHGGSGRIPLNKHEPILEVAKEAGLDPDRFDEDSRDRSLLDIIAADHTTAVEEHGVFGTPTFVFENGNAGYLKMFVPSPDEAGEFLDHFVAIMSDSPFAGELKRPQPPWPKGAVS